MINIEINNFKETIEKLKELGVDVKFAPKRNCKPMVEDCEPKHHDHHDMHCGPRHMHHCRPMHDMKPMEPGMHCHRHEMRPMGPGMHHHHHGMRPMGPLMRHCRPMPEMGPRMRRRFGMECGKPEFGMRPMMEPGMHCHRHGMKPMGPGMHCHHHEMHPMMHRHYGMPRRFTMGMNPVCFE